MKFIEDPAHRGPNDRPIMGFVIGLHLSHAYVRVSRATYFTEHFRRWIDESLMPRLDIRGGSALIEVVP